MAGLLQVRRGSEGIIQVSEDAWNSVYSKNGFNVVSPTSSPTPAPTPAPTQTSQFSAAAPITRQPNEGPIELTQRIQNGSTPAPTTTSGTGDRLLGPAEYTNLRTQYGATPATFDNWFRRDDKGNIYLKGGGGTNTAPSAGSTPANNTAPAPTTNSTTETTNNTQSANTQSSVVVTSDSERARIRQEALDRIKTDLSGGAEKPSVFKTADEFKRLRQEQGIVQDEEELASLRNEAALANQEMRQFKSTAGQGVSEGGRIGAISEAERNLNFRLEGLAIREQNVLSRVNSKNTYINAAIKAGQEDYSTALENYNTEFTRNLKAVELYNQELDDQQKDALTGLTTITNLLKDKNLDFDSLDPAVKTQFETLSLQAGLPSGIMQSIFAAKPNEEIASIQKNDDGTTTVLYKQNGKISNVQTYGEVKPDGTLLTVDEARKLGVPYGTKRSEAFGMQSAEDTLGGLSEDQRKALMQIRGEAQKDPDIKGFVEVRDAYDRIQSAAKNPSAAGDLALIFAYMKILDPNSTVREGEFANAENAGSVPERIWAQYNKVKEGTRLTEVQRKDFIDTSKGLYEPKRRNYEQAVKFYKDQAEIYNIPTDRVVRSYLTPDESPGNINTAPLNKSYQSLDVLIRERPEYVSIIEEIEKQSPNMSDGDILRILGSSDFNKPLGMGEKGLQSLASSIVKQESGGSYSAIGQVPAGYSDADKALGKYQIVPKYHFAKIGLANTPANRQKFLQSPALQDKLFNQILAGLAKQYDNDPRKIAAAYYGGAKGAAVVGTRAGDKPQYAGRKEYPSINQYVASVVGRLS